MAMAAAIMGLAGGVASAYGQIAQSKAAASAAKFNATVSEENAQIATQKAAWAGEEGDQAASKSEMGTAAAAGHIKASQGASGVEVGTGSFADVDKSVKEIGMLDALTIRSNAARQAYGYQTEAYSDKAQTELDQFSAKNDAIAGKIGAASTLLSSGANAAQYSSGSFSSNKGGQTTGAGGDAYSNYLSNKMSYGL